MFLDRTSYYLNYSKLRSHLHYITVMMAMASYFFILHVFFLGLVSPEISFTYHGFQHANLTLDGAAFLRSDGILAVTKESSYKLFGHAIYPSSLQFKESGQGGEKKSTAFDFSTTFVFSINPKYTDLGGHGLAFVLQSRKQLLACLANQYLGLPNDTSVAEFNEKFLAVEFDVVQNLELKDINDNHVGIDISSLVSNISEPAAYYVDTNRTKNVSINLKGGDPVQAWIDYSGRGMLLNITLSPLGISRPDQPLISLPIDLSGVLDDYMYVGFSASTGLLAAAHNVMGWSFRVGGKVEDLDLSKLPSLVKPKKVVKKRGFVVGLTFASVAAVLLLIGAALHFLHKFTDEDEILEDWEIRFSTHRFKYSELSTATRGFGEGNLVGKGGFGKVYRGVIPDTGLEVAIKRVAQGSCQGMQEFIAEITSLGRLKHRNLVQLHGWCRRRDELLIIYDYIPNGSLDKLLYENPQQKKKILTWGQRYKILMGVAQALLYLHEECQQIVVHRDVKPSNVLIDADLNAKLGDFGLARIYEHGIQPKTTHIVGTLGYLAPEFTRTGKATRSTDTYGFGVLLLEVASGRRPIEPQKTAQELVLVDWVKELHSQGTIVQAVDPTLDVYNLHEAELVLNLGLICTHLSPEYRPTMRRVVQVLSGDASLPNFHPDFHAARATADYSYIYHDDSDPFSGKATSSKGTSFSSFDNKISPKHASRITF